MDEEKKYELEEFVAELESLKARHTELITVYVSAGYDLIGTIKQLEAEKSTAKNIKSKSTQKNVIDALESLIRQLRLIKRTPKNGLALFAGNVSEKEGQNDFKVWSIEPPIPLNMRLYRCDQQFILDPLKEMLEATEVYGLVVIDRKEATLGVLEGKNIKMLQHMTSGVPGKTEKGGQSAARYARIREGLAKEFYRRVADAMKQHFFDMPKLKGIIIGGPVPTKDDFLKEGQLVAKLKDIVLGLKDIGNTDASGLNDLVEASQDLLAEQEIIHEKKLLDKFLESLGKGGKAVYKRPDVKKALDLGAVDTLIISKKLAKKEIMELVEQARNIAAKIELVSEETEEGQQFRNLGGIGALLRFAIN